MYYPSLGAMNAEQRQFYERLRSSIDAARPLDVEGNISYLFVDIYGLLNLRDEHGYEFVRECLLQMARFYPQYARVYGACRSWAADCLLAQGRFDEWLEETRFTDPESIFHTSTHFSNLRVNVALQAGRVPDPEDLVRMAGFRAKAATRKHPAAFVQKLQDIFFERRAEVERILVSEALGTDMIPVANPVTALVAIAAQSEYTPRLFCGAVTDQPLAPFRTIPFYTMPELLGGIRAMARQAEDCLLLERKTLNQNSDAHE